MDFTYERLDESSPTPSWVRAAARSGKTFEGPNGNEVVAYEWKWKWGLKQSKREGGLIDAPVSDWDEALQCETCGRNIVHIYWVKDVATNTVDSYGQDHLHQALGYPREVGKRKAKEIQGKVQAKGLLGKRLALKIQRAGLALSKLKAEYGKS